MTFDEAIAWIHSIGRFGVNPGLERMNVLMDRLGNPHHRLNFVHIGGTNGKGTTAALLEVALRACGCRVGLYTSPYLVNFNNRISLNGEDISPVDLVEHVQKIRPLVEEIAEIPHLGHPTEFEVVTALAMDYYAAKKPDLVVLEVGLGGRLDATNIVSPLVSVITNVSMDHTSVLGDSVEEVAGEKAGIIKEGVPLITAAEDYAVREVLFRAAAQKNALAYCVVNEKKEEQKNYRRFLLQESKESATNKISIINYDHRKKVSGGQVFSYRGLNKEWDDLFLPLKGRYQVQNAAVSLAALEHVEQSMGLSCEKNVLQKTWQNFTWPGRLEVLREKPLVVLDGAHNPAAIKELSQAMQEFFSYGNLILVMGIMQDKNIREMMQNIVPAANTLIFTRPGLPRAASPRYLKELASELSDATIYAVPDIKNALTRALEMAAKSDLVLVTGSFYTVSEARQFLI